MMWKGFSDILIDYFLSISESIGCIFLTANQKEC